MVVPLFRDETIQPSISKIIENKNSKTYHQNKMKYFIEDIPEEDNIKNKMLFELVNKRVKPFPNKEKLILEPMTICRDTFFKNMYENNKIKG